MQRCPECDNPLKADSINIKEGVALCPECGILTRLSAVTYCDRSIQEILDQPPDKCSVESDDSGVVISASTRSVGIFLASVGFALFWNGIVSMFVLLACGGLYTNLIGPLPDGFPLPGVENGQPILNGHPMELGETLFLCVFLIPFVTVGTGIIVVSLVYLFGRVEVVFKEWKCYVATGIGPIKWKTHFDLNQLRAVRLVSGRSDSEGRSSPFIELSANRTIKFGSMLNSDRMEWMLAILKTATHHKANDNRQDSQSPDWSWLNQLPQVSEPE